MLACLFIASAGACSVDDSDGGMSGDGGAGSGGSGGESGSMTAGMGGGTSGTGGSGAGGSGAMGGVEMMGGTGGGDAGSGGSAGMNDAGGGADGGDAGDSGSDGGGGGSLFEGECTLENPWDCRVCEEQATCDTPTYEDNGDGTVSSSCCGLVWQRDTEWVVDPENMSDDCRVQPGAAGCYEFEAAQAHCTALTLAGGGWRMPLPVEMRTLMLLDRPVSPYIDTEAFPNAAISDLYWTAMDGPDTDNEAWLAGYGGTSAAVRQKNTEHFIRCVRIGP